MRGRCSDYCHGDEVTFLPVSPRKEIIQGQWWFAFALDLWEQNIKHTYIKSSLLKLERQKQP